MNCGLARRRKTMPLKSSKLIRGEGLSEMHASQRRQERRGAADRTEMREGDRERTDVKQPFF